MISENAHGHLLGHVADLAPSRRACGRHFLVADITLRSGDVWRTGEKRTSVAVGLQPLVSEERSTTIVCTAPRAGFSKRFNVEVEGWRTLAE
jgi:hypothetical protein